MSMRNRRSLIGREEEQESNPLDGLANLADVMLVLAVGILLALIINWNLDISTVSQQVDPETVDTEDALEFSDEQLEEMSGEDQIDDQNLTQLGSVYYDEKTGTYYIVSDKKSV